MTLQETRILRQEFTAKIEQMIEELEKKTGCTVAKIEVDHEQECGMVFVKAIIQL